VSEKGRKGFKRENRKNVKDVKGIEWLKKNIPIIIGIFVPLYPIINTAYKIIYGSKCEKFYKLPGKYFDVNINNRLFYLGCIFIFLLFCIAPAFMNRWDKENGEVTKWNRVVNACVALVIGMLLGVFNLYNLLEIMQQIYKAKGGFQIINEMLNRYPYVTVVVVVALGIVSVLGVTLLDEIRSIKYGWLQNIIDVIVVVSFVISFLVMVYGTIFKISVSVEDQTKYEFIMYDETEYVILSTKDGCNLIVPFEIDKNGQYIFDTSKYMLKKTYDGIYQYKDIQTPPHIGELLKES